MSVNKVILVGNLGADPESRTTQNGNTVTNLRLATTERVKDREGTWTDHTEWHRIVCWGRTAENAAQYLRKGRQVYIEGRLRTRKWQDRDGNDRWSTEIVADNVQFLASRDGSRGGGDGGSGGDPGGSSGGGASSGSEAAPGPSYSGGGQDDDIPF